MILDSQSTKMANVPYEVLEDNPPSYDLATDCRRENAASSHTSSPLHSKPPVAKASPNSQGPSMPPTTVYHYINPVTAEHITSLLAPDHPEMICLQAGEHIPEAKFGLIGLIAAVIWFPLGIGLCLLDRRVKCTRCGRLLENGLCD